MVRSTDATVTPPGWWITIQAGGNAATVNGTIENVTQGFSKISLQANESTGAFWGCCLQSPSQQCLHPHACQLEFCSRY